MPRPSAILSLLLLAVPAMAHAQEPRGKAMQKVTVRPGDTLWAIAQTYLKDPTRWDEILRYNKLPTSDPTVALPGTVLNVPIDLIREELRAAKLIYLVREVLSRKSDTADWTRANSNMQLFRGDGLRTLAQSRARVEFPNKSILSLEPDSMAILKPPRQEDHDLRLMSGSIQASAARVLTPSALVTPKMKGTKYTAKVLDDLSTLVQVLDGKADVSGAGKTIEVKGGFSTDVPLDRAPSIPARIPDIGALRAEMSDLSAAPRPAEIAVSRPEPGLRAGAPDADLKIELQKLSMGAPVAAYEVQVSAARGFEKVLFKKTYDAAAGVVQDINLKDSGLPRGEYWVRVAVIDLLGSKGDYSQPRPYRVE